jgi:predicted metallopeptidase
MKDIVKLREKYGINKQIPLNYENEILTALSHYSELNAVKIIFKLTNRASVPYGTKPAITNCLRSKKNRVYIINILEKANYPESMALFKNLTSRMRIGVIAHELMHVKQYHFGRFSLIKTIGLFAFQSSRRRLEREADRGAIEHGLGEELLEHAVYLRSIPGYTVKRPAIKEDYLQPTEIENCLRNLNTFSR